MIQGVRHTLHPTTYPPLLRLMTIDSHQHFWHYELPKHDWIDDDMAAIRRDFTPDDLRPILDANGVDGCVAVQADQTRAETDFLLDLAATHDWIRGVVGWIDLRAPDLEAQLDEYEDRRAALVGWRHVVQGEPDPYFLLRPDFLRGIEAIGRRGYVYDILIFPHQLVSALELAKRCPEVSFVLDHLAKPYARDGYFDGWAAGLSALAQQPNVSCKLSGLITEADYDNWTEEQLLPYLRHALEAFGPGRCLFGSDWPVLRVAGDYGRMKALLERAIVDLDPAERAAVMGGNCARVYGL